MREKSLKLMFSGFIIIVMGIWSRANAQIYCKPDEWTNNVGLQWWNNNVPSKYALAENQISDLNKIRAHGTKNLRPLQKELTSLRQEMRNYSDFGWDIAKQKAYTKKIRSLKNKIMNINMDTRLKIHKILSKEQMAYFSNGGYEWWDMDENCWHSDHEDYELGYGSWENMMVDYGCGC